MNGEIDPKTKYVLHYATNLKTPTGTGPSKMVEFRSWLRYFFYVLRNKDARDAVRADRFHLLVIK